MQRSTSDTYALEYICHKVLYSEAIQEAIDSVLPRKNADHHMTTGSDDATMWNEQDDYDGETLEKEGKEARRKAKKIRKAKSRRGHHGGQWWTRGSMADDDTEEVRTTSTMRAMGARVSR